MEQLVARQAHNLEVVRSSRAPATTDDSDLVAFMHQVAFFISCRSWFKPGIP